MTESKPIPPRDRLSIFARQKPRAIFRNSDELAEEPAQKITFQVETSVLPALPS